MKRPAFTLIELIVVLALIGILLAIVGPNTNYFKDMKEALEIKELKRDILYARNKAIVECEVITISFSLEKNCYIIQQKNSEIIKTKYFKNGTTLSVKGDSDKFIFNINGNTGQSGTIYFYDRKGARHKLSVTPVSGKANIE